MLGDSWFKRVKKEHGAMHFLRKGQEKKYKDDEIKLEHWVADNERFITERNDGYLCWSPHSIFIVEAKELSWNGAQNLSMMVVVSTVF